MRYIIENKEYQLHMAKRASLMRTPHLHRQLEMIYMYKGQSGVLLDGKEYIMGDGDVFMAFPNQIHGYEPITPVECVVVIFSAELDPHMGGLLKNKIPADPVIKAKDLPADAAKRMDEIVRLYGSELPWEQLRGKYQLMDFFSYVFPEMDYIPRPADNDSIKDILSYCSAHFTEPINLDSVAEALHLSRYYISHIISERMGISFIRYINGMRVDKACNLLASGTDITEVCYASGFSSIRTFNRVFLQITGVPPRQYRKK